MKVHTDLEKVKYCIRRSKVCRFLFYFPLELYYLLLRLRIRFTSDKTHVLKRYRKVFHKDPNLDNPVTMNEYLTWRKLFDRDPLLPRCSDKYRVREYVAEKIGDQYLVPLLAATDSVDKIDFDKLPDRFVIKVNHGSGQNIIVKDKQHEDLEAIKVRLHYWMKRSHYYNNREWQYKEIEPMIVVEELLLDENGNVPKDYKFHVFAGKVEMIQVDTNRFETHKRIFYSPNWEELPFNWVPVDEHDRPKYPKADPQPKPDVLETMIQLAEKLAEDFPYVRVDFYYTGGKIYFGELTFTHENGLAKFFPDHYDIFYGQKIPQQKKVKST